jgi:hypothetical protein
LEAISKNEPSICLNSIPPSQENPIKDIDLSFSCIISTGIKHQQEDYCELIDTDCNGKEECLDYTKQKRNACKYFITKDTSFCGPDGGSCFNLCHLFWNEKNTMNLCQELVNQEQFIELEYTSPLKHILFD